MKLVAIVVWSAMSAPTHALLDVVEYAGLHYSGQLRYGVCTATISLAPFIISHFRTWILIFIACKLIRSLSHDIANFAIADTPVPCPHYVLVCTHTPEPKTPCHGQSPDTFQVPNPSHLRALFLPELAVDVPSVALLALLAL